MALSKEQVVEELDRVSASSEFRNKPVMKRLLTYLVNEHIEGRSDVIKGYSIAVDVFGQGKGFDSDRSAVVRNSAVRLRGLLNAYYLGAGSADPVRIDIPKGGYAPKISTTSHDAPAVPRNGNEDRGIGVAVLPFSYQSGSGKYEYIKTGISQELSDALTRFDDLRVIGVGLLMGHASLPSQIADEIQDKHIDYLIGGTVNVHQDQGRLTIRLINASNNHQIWKRNYIFDLSLEDLVQIQEEIATRISSHIGGEYGRINQARFQLLTDSRPHSLSEHEILLKYYHVSTILAEDAIIDYQETLARALQDDPDSALLNALMASQYSNVWCFLLPGYEEAYEKIAYHAEKAYSLNPNHQVVISNLASKCFFFGERARFFNLYERYINTLANSSLRQGALAMYACYLGEWARGMQLLDFVIENNIHVPPWIHTVPAMNHYRQGNYEEALIEANKCDIHGLFWAPAIRSTTLGQLGRHDQAVEEYQAVLKCRPDFPENGCILLGRMLREPSLLEHFCEGFEKSGISFG